MEAGNRVPQRVTWSNVAYFPFLLSPQPFTSQANLALSLPNKNMTKTSYRPQDKAILHVLAQVSHLQKAFPTSTMAPNILGCGHLGSQQRHIIPVNWQHKFWTGSTPLWGLSYPVVHLLSFSLGHSVAVTAMWSEGDTQVIMKYRLKPQQTQDLVSNETPPETGAGVLAHTAWPGFKDGHFWGQPTQQETQKSQMWGGQTTWVEPEKGKDCPGLRVRTARTLPEVLVSNLGITPCSGDSYASLPKLVGWETKGLNGQVHTHTHTYPPTHHPPTF